jgi:hypothetical protein
MSNKPKLTIRRQEPEQVTMSLIPERYKHLVKLLSDDSSLFRLFSIANEYLPHKYIITDSHRKFALNHRYKGVTDSALRLADKYGLRCGEKGCTLRLEEHRMNVVAVIYLTRECTVQEQQDEFDKYNLIFGNAGITAIEFIMNPFKKKDNEQTTGGA